jgi:hypothetical protein
MTAQTTTTPMTPMPATPSPVRASDVDRSDTVARLHHALGEGRLDLAETDERVAAAYAARYRSELPPLLADLPDSSGPSGWELTGPPAWNAIWSGLVWRAHGIVFPASSDKPPTARQCRIATRLALLALVWMTACAVLGAALVSA